MNWTAKDQKELQEELNAWTADYRARTAAYRASGRNPNKFSPQVPTQGQIMEHVGRGQGDGRSRRHNLPLSGEQHLQPRKGSDPCS
jgi:hypothetical protein